jgi:hypothetical protein
MGMLRFGVLFRDTAERETRTARVPGTLSPDNPNYLPADEYGFDELYCDERNCDCRRVMINVLARRHYHMFKNVVEDTAHPAHGLLRRPEVGAGSARSRSIPPPPPRRGKRKKWR